MADVWMIQSGHRRGLFVEMLASPLIGDGPRTQHIDGDFAVEVFVVGTEDLCLAKTSYTCRMNDWTPGQCSLSFGFLDVNVFKIFALDSILARDNTISRNVRGPDSGGAFAETKKTREKADEHLREFVVGDRVKVKLRTSRLVDATIKAIIDRTDGQRLQVDFGKDETALIHLWQVIERIL